MDETADTEMNLPRPRLILSALKGGAGKTTVSIALLAAWRSQGLRAVPFKKGPDYIDTAWLARAAGATCRNLDPYLMGWEPAVRLFAEHTSADEIAVIEGNRGLFDGLDAAGSISTAELAKRIKAPVVLILDCTKATRTVAALVHGCKGFDPGVNLGGVILNHIGGPRHERVIRESIQESVGVPVLGAIPRQRRDMPERHMGLVPTFEHPEADSSIAWLADLARKYLDLEALAALARSAPELEPGPAEAPKAPLDAPRVRIGVIQDSAFQFYYPENLQALEDQGAELVVISALEDKSLPPLDGLYIGGGFPETQAQALAANVSFRRDLKEQADQGLPIYAECGGLMFLGRTLVMEGKEYPMSGVLDLAVEVHQRPQGHGYTRVKVDRENPFYPLGTELKGHEFHYSRVANLSGEEGGLAFESLRGKGIAGKRDGLTRKNVLATYTHIHALGTPLWAEGMVGAARAHRRDRT